MVRERKSARTKVSSAWKGLIATGNEDDMAKMEDSAIVEGADWAARLGICLLRERENRQVTLTTMNCGMLMLWSR